MRRKLLNQQRRFFSRRSSSGRDRKVREINPLRMRWHRFGFTPPNRQGWKNLIPALDTNAEQQLKEDVNKNTSTPPERYPIHLDIGCGSGKYLLELANIYSSKIFLGIEIRESQVTEANEMVKTYFEEQRHNDKPPRMNDTNDKSTLTHSNITSIDSSLSSSSLSNGSKKGLENITFFHANANAATLQILSDSIRSELSQLSTGLLSASILYPDPWFKRRHHKRRLVQPEFVHGLSNILPQGALVHVETDVEDLYYENLRQHFVQEDSTFALIYERVDGDELFGIGRSESLASRVPTLRVLSDRARRNTRKQVGVKGEFVAIFEKIS
eukprot:g3101.t1